jgi:hypothetical protein
MTRTETACYGLIASAFILAGMLLVQLSSMPNNAEAALVIARDNFTLLTAKTRTDEESLFIINNFTDRLLVYKLDLAHNRLDLAGGADLSGIFATRGGTTGGTRGGRR